MNPKTTGITVILSLLISTGLASSDRSEVSTATLRVPSVPVPPALGIFWNQFLVVLQSGSSAAIRSHCTPEGYRSFISRMNPKVPASSQWKHVGEGLSKLGEIHWQTSTTMSAYGRIGPPDKEQSVSFVRTPKGWKLDEWSPGD